MIERRWFAQHDTVARDASARSSLAQEGERESRRLASAIARRA